MPVSALFNLFSSSFLFIPPYLTSFLLFLFISLGFFSSWIPDNVSVSTHYRVAVHYFSRHPPLKIGKGEKSQSCNAFIPTAFNTTTKLAHYFIKLNISNLLNYISLVVHYFSPHAPMKSVWWGKKIRVAVRLWNTKLAHDPLSRASGIEFSESIFALYASLVPGTCVPSIPGCAYM